MKLRADAFFLNIFNLHVARAHVNLAQNTQDQRDTEMIRVTIKKERKKRHVYT